MIDNQTHIWKKKKQIKYRTSPNTDFVRKKFKNQPSRNTMDFEKVLNTYEKPVRGPNM